MGGDSQRERKRVETQSAFPAWGAVILKRGRTKTEGDAQLKYLSSECSLSHTHTHTDTQTHTHTHTHRQTFTRTHTKTHTHTHTHTNQRNTREECMVASQVCGQTGRTTSVCEIGFCLIIRHKADRWVLLDTHTHTHKESESKPAYYCRGGVSNNLVKLAIMTLFIKRDYLQFLWMGATVRCVPVKCFIKALDPGFGYGSGPNRAWLSIYHTNTHSHITYRDSEHTPSYAPQVEPFLWRTLL